MILDTRTHWWCSACGRLHPKNREMLAHETSATPASRGANGSALPGSTSCACCALGIFGKHGVGHVGPIAKSVAA